MKTLLKIAATIVASFLVGCVVYAGKTFVDQIQVRSLPEKNPTTYIFKAKVATVHQVISNELRQLELNRRSFHFVGDTLGEIYIQTPLDSAQFSSDFYLANPYESLEGPPLSRLYADENGKPLQYFAEFLIHIIPMNDDSTKVEIQTSEACVITGISMRIYDIGGNYTTQSVEPTTIEEYEILLKIGEALGVKNEMPELILPK